MGKVERFEDLIAWQKARELTRVVYRMTKQGDISQNFRLTGQLQAAAVSVMSNIAEGFERSGDGEFHQFLKIAKGSCGEVRSLVYVAFDTEYLDQPTCDRLVRQAEEVSRIVAGLRAAVDRRRNESRSIREVE